MKYIGLFIIFCSVSFFGLYRAQKEKNVLKSIKSTESIISTIILCIKNEHATIDDIFSYIKHNSNSSTGIFIDNLTPEKLSNAKEIAKECNFSDDETVLSIISDVFGILGRYSADEQIKELEIAREKLKTYYNSVESDIKTKASLFAKSSLLCGILAVILLI